MNYKETDIRKRLAESPLRHELEKQQGEVLPYLLERFFVCRNYRRHITTHDAPADTDNEAYFKLLLADIGSVLVDVVYRVEQLEGELRRLKMNPDEGGSADMLPRTAVLAWLEERYETGKTSGSNGFWSYEAARKHVIAKVLDDFHTRFPE